MKTKLLKKIRKRYEITRVTAPILNPDNPYFEVKTPFYIIRDTNSEYRAMFSTTKELVECIECVREWIRADYYRTKTNRRKEPAVQKVWYK